MAVTSKALGMNARNYLYIRRYNPPSAKRMADDKLETKKILIENNINTTGLIAAFYDREQIRRYNWYHLPKEGFVIKPARGYGGGGILVIKKWEDYIGTSVVGQQYNIKQLESHLLDILDGAYSLQFLPDKSYIEERVNPSQFFKKIAPVGIPDIRIIVFNRVPIMAMLRLPTEESGGKANLHLGALGVGVDMRTGITTNAVYKGKMIRLIPGTKMKIRGLKIPQWDELLLLAAKTQEAIGLGYAGVDIVFDAKKGPLILEVNARPGLAIQLANNKSLRTRLERIENMYVPSAERGVEVAKSLFTEPTLEKVSTSPKILTLIQNVVLKNGDKEIAIKAKLDTGAYRTSIDLKLAEELGLTINDEMIFVKSASGQKHRPTANLTYELAGKKIRTIATLADRTDLQYPMIVGRKDLVGFLIKPVVETDIPAVEDDLDAEE
jgi:alpha-L-glutamate ligase-like protein